MNLTQISYIKLHGNWTKDSWIILNKSVFNPSQNTLNVFDISYGTFSDKSIKEMIGDSYFPNLTVVRLGGLQDASDEIYSLINNRVLKQSMSKISELNISNIRTS